MMTHKKRLLFLAEALEREAKEGNDREFRFSLNVWLIGRGNNVSGGPVRKCGTVGCAIGLAMTLPEFKAEGLEAVSQEEYSDYWKEHKWLPSYGGKVHFDAVAEFFGIDRMGAEFLFHRTNYYPDDGRGVQGELAVARRIRDYVSEAGAWLT